MTLSKSIINQTFNSILFINLKCFARLQQDEEALKSFGHPEDLEQQNSSDLESSREEEGEAEEGFQFVSSLVSHFVLNAHPIEAENDDGDSGANDTAVPEETPKEATKTAAEEDATKQESHVIAEAVAVDNDNDQEETEDIKTEDALVPEETLKEATKTAAEEDASKQESHVIAEAVAVDNDNDQTETEDIKTEDALVTEKGDSAVDSKSEETAEVTEAAAIQEDFKLISSLTAHIVQGKKKNYKVFIKMNDTSTINCKLRCRPLMVWILLCVKIIFSKCGSISTIQLSPSLPP